MSRTEDDGLIVEIDPRQLNLTLDPETEHKAKTKDEPRERDEPASHADDEIKAGGSEDAITALRKQLEALEAENARNRAAIQAKEREAAEARTAAHQTYGYAQQRDYDLVNTTIANDKARAEAIKRELKVARESGNTDLESDLMIENARIGARLEQSEVRKREIEEAYRREQAKRAAPVQPSDPVEAAIQNVSPKSQAWLRAHPECVTDEVLNAKVLLADREARRKGYAADTPEYFKYIEEQMGYRQAQRADEDDTSDEPETRRSDKSERRMSYAAPVSRESGSGSGLKPTQRRLSREQVEMAEAMGMTAAQYATWLAKAEKDQKYVNH